MQQMRGSPDHRGAAQTARRHGPSVQAALGTVLGLGVALLPSCSAETPPNPVKEAFTQAGAVRETGTSVAFRFAQEGRGGVHLYRLPSLDPVDWDFGRAGAAPANIIGFSADEDLIYALTTAAEFVALDLVTGRTRVIDTNVVLATLAPAGAPYFVRGDGSIARVTRRAVADWATRVEPLPSAIWASARNRLMAVSTTETGERWLMSLADGRPTITHPIPQGEVSVSLWGDVAVVRTDSGLAVFDPADSAGAVFRKVRPAPGPLAISPAAHHIYTVDIAGELLVYDRFELRRLHRVQLPGPATGLRVDPTGRLVLVRAATDETIWLVDVVQWEVVATIASSWNQDLPTVAPDGTILLRQGDDVVAVSSESFAVTDRVEGAATDLWLSAAWDPRRPTLQLASDSVPETAPTGGAFYVQVSSTRNIAWAEDFAQNLRRAGMDANVLSPRDPDDLYRVVLGPFPTREAAEAVSRQLGLPSWITSRDTTPRIP
jgi:hypothetical protein